MQLFYVIKIELQIANICWCNVDVHTTYISNSSNCNDTTPSICSEYVDIWHQIFPTYISDSLAHTDITTSAYTYGHRNPRGLNIRHSLYTLDYPKGILFMARMLIIYEEYSRH
jgi:predicted Zn-dependent protease